MRLGLLGRRFKIISFHENISHFYYFTFFHFFKRKKNGIGKMKKMQTLRWVSMFQHGLIFSEIRMKNKVQIRPFRNLKKRRFAKRKGRTKDFEGCPYLVFYSVGAFCLPLLMYLAPRTPSCSASQPFYALHNPGELTQRARKHTTLLQILLNTVLSLRHNPKLRSGRLTNLRSC